jgi:hypothetical protein
MSDYFGALLRSAGVVSSDALAPRATPIGQGDLVEQEVEVEVGAPESMTAAQSPEAPAAIEPAPSTPTDTRPASPERREVMRSEPVGSPFTRPGLDEVHPVVRAALEWVAADPEPGARAVPAVSGSAESQRASEPSSRRQLPQVPTPILPPVTPPDTVAAAVTESVRPRHAPPSPVEHQAVHEVPPAPARAAAPVQPSAVRDLDLALPPASRTRQPAVTTIVEAAPVPQERIEVHIGTIHVRVDPPPAPHAVVQPAPPPQRPPQPARAADRGSFSRSRVPRI